MPSELQQCVSDKVGTLIDEGYEREQALAIAYRKCREGKSKAVDDGELESIVKALGGDLDLVQYHLNATDKGVMRPTQQETGYMSLSAKKGQACANCRFFDSHMSMCALIENYPEDIVLTGWCSRWEAKPEAEPQAVTIEAESVTINPPMTDMGAMAKKGEQGAQKVGRTFSKKNEAFLRTMMQTIKDMLVKAGMMEMEDEETEEGKASGFKVFKHQGKWYWTAIWSNNFIDRDKEIISQAAHDRYLARLKMNLTPLPELWYWHIPGTKHGKALWVGRVDHLMRAVGEFEDTPLARAFIQHYRKTRKKVSHGFRFPTWRKHEGVYEDYNTFELSPLPPYAASSPFTDFEELITMTTITDDQRRDLEAIIGKEMAAEIISNTEALSKSIEKTGVAYKDFADVPNAEAAAKETPPALGKLVLSLIDTQAAFATKQAELDKRLTDEEKAHKAKAEALEAENKALKEQLAQVQEKLTLRPRASEDSSTVVTDEKVKQELAQKVADSDPFWGHLNVPKNTPTGGNHNG